MRAGTTDDPLIALSLGAGVQSTTLALLAEAGELPMPDVAIFADTGWEPRSVYEHLDRLEAAVSFPVLRVSVGNIRRDLVEGGARRYASVPYFIRNADGSQGIGRRQCTAHYKVEPITRKVRELLGSPAPDYRRVARGRLCEQWVGFSTDEISRANRRKDSQGVSYLTVRYPLLDLGLSRTDCSRWLTEHGWGSTAKSACIGCPYNGNRAWRDLRDNRPDEWADAVVLDAAIRKGGARGEQLRGEAFLHRSMLPLAEAPIDRVQRKEWAEAQTDLLDAVADAEMEERLRLEEEGAEDGCSPYGCRSDGAVDVPLLPTVLRAS